MLNAQTKQKNKTVFWTRLDLKTSSEKKHTDEMGKKQIRQKRYVYQSNNKNRSISISNREHQLLVRLQSKPNDTYQNLGAFFGSSPRTIESHMRNLCKKLNAASKRNLSKQIKQIILKIKII